MEGKEISFAYVLVCLDPKIKDPLSRIFSSRFGAANYFMPTELGGVKDLLSPEVESDKDRLIRKMKMAYRVHPFGLIVLVNHSNCGAYNLTGHTFADPSEEEKFHTEELKKAVAVIKKAFPEVAVEYHYFLKDEQRLAW